jgi:predicted ester cyclase
MTQTAVEHTLTQQNKDVIKRYVDTWNRGDMRGLVKFWSPDIVHHTRAGSHGYEFTRTIVEEFTKNFPGMRFQIDDIFAEGDRVLTRMTWRAKHINSYMGSVPDNKEISCTVVGIARLANGLIAEHWGVTDELAMMAQLGLLPREYLEAMA